jgi:hypothetical protein
MPTRSPTGSVVRTRDMAMSLARTALWIDRHKIGAGVPLTENGV